MESGSLVSIIFQSWYKKHLSNIPIHLVNKLDIWGLSASSYLYLGYVVMDMEFVKEVVVAPTTMSVLALICPDPPGPDQTSVIVETDARASLSTVNDWLRYVLTSLTLQPVLFLFRVPTMLLRLTFPHQPQKRMMEWAL